ncbi:hypothetical protein EDD37DRAFT_619589 [Exophiala viscosa]|uniref:uncharacterized protein n=1 Tax=Exophiala viscosa TaxID=2486360 RepID=UPI0021A22365|nr:hypothetical protein EDD37DRAFT_619589 [Exophiala viscosa]
MVQLRTVHAHNAAIFQSRPIVAVFAGATAGIGEATLRALAAAHGTTGKGLRVYIVGRKREAFQRIVSDCTRLCPAGQFNFVLSPDLSLLTNVDKACAEITKAEQENAKGEQARIDILCMSQGDFNFDGYQETKEGIEWRYSLLYHSRMKFVVNLLPLLRGSDFPAHVISVFGAGKEGDLHLDDLSLRGIKVRGLTNVRSHTVYLHTFFMEYLAAQNPGKLSLVHVYPGLVMTPAFKNPGVPIWFKAIWTVITPVTKLLTTSPAEAGERILFLASPLRFPARGATEQSTATKGGEIEVGVAKGSDGKVGSGAYAVEISGEAVENEKAGYKKYRKEGVGEKLVAYTLKAFEVIKSGKVFTE